MENGKRGGIIKGGAPLELVLGWEAQVIVATQLPHLGSVAWHPKYGPQAPDNSKTGSRGPAESGKRIQGSYLPGRLGPHLPAETTHLMLAAPAGEIHPGSNCWEGCAAVCGSRIEKGLCAASSTNPQRPSAFLKGNGQSPTKHLNCVAWEGEEDQRGIGVGDRADQEFLCCIETWDPEWS